MLNRRTFLGAAGAAILSAPAFASAPIIIGQAGLVFLSIAVNGRAAKALIDTGSVRGLQLTEALAAQAGLALAESGEAFQRYHGGPRPVLRARLASLSLPGAELRDVEASVSPGDIEAIAGQIGETFEAILGWPLLSSQAFTIDYPRAAFEPGAQADGGLALPLERGLPLPVTAGRLAGQSQTFLIDTGAPWCNVDQSLAPGAAANGRVELGFELGGRAFSTTFRVRDLSAMTRGLGARAVIGHRFLRDFRFVWAPEAGAVRLLAPAS